MKRPLPLLLLSLLLLAGCSGIKITKPMLKLMLGAYSKTSTEVFYADSCEHRTGIPYVQDGDPAQVLDVYYADASVRKDAVLIDIHGGFYVGGDRTNNRNFASVFLREGYDVVLVEYRLNDGKRDVADELADCAAALDYLTVHADELRLNPDRMFLTGDSAGGHLALYMAEASEDRSMPIHPDHFTARGALLNCPAYDFATFGESTSFAPSALSWFIGPRYQDKDWMRSMSPRTYLSNYHGPLFLSTCTNDFIRTQSLLLKADCDSLSRALDFVDISSDDKDVDHVHNVTKPHLPASRDVNTRMLSFLSRNL